ncbi:NAD(P)-dependent oxidoreductase [Novosphingobium resinovorum]|uniref:precorrin-2 dehydrogenase/sirohydrochlorin ferrochelatase family protein n=1 Tax=Novosphingobium TaxID=165696 RepID=UPI001B3C7193|nr:MULTISPECIES: NAD(P)-dependent oxidoreductase [Novosphingobium]MBF7010133.1 siroheme synthase [Novosphingobium sp. HR1a]WJM28151.1 NAD(P)-dependent oxidoreductase [Novosphingobium resinovorum]
MIESLPLFHRIAGRPVVVLGEGEAAAAKRRLVERAGGVVHTDISEGVAAGAKLAFVVHEEEAQAEADVAAARRAGMLVNATDRPALCDFTVPSILDRSPVLIAVGTGGASAGLAKQLRLRLEALLPQSLGVLASALQAARGRLRERFPEAGDRRRALDAALTAGGILDPLVASSAERVDGWLQDAIADEGELVEITLGSDDPDDLTLRQARLLGAADVVIHDPRVAPAILDRARADAQRHVLQDTTPRAGLTVVLTLG